MRKEKINVFWFRRDLRIHDNAALFHALSDKHPVLPIFIFDSNILDELPKDDPRVTFIHKSLTEINNRLAVSNGSLQVFLGEPVDVWSRLMNEYVIDTVYVNEDYEPYGIGRDNEIASLLSTKQIKFKSFKDHVVFAKDEITKADGRPYTVYTPYKNKWLAQFTTSLVARYDSSSISNYYPQMFPFPKIEEIGFEEATITVRDYSIDDLTNYENERDYPSLNSTSHLSPFLRFGLVSIREIILNTHGNSTFLSELIWREFFIQILYHFPASVHANFKPQYNRVQWRNDVNEFEKWKEGNTGYPIVDAGMRELNQTGYMHNRVRMIVAGFLCKHLLIDWRWGEAYFAEKLLDYELASNVGNWQWAAGTGCDAAPYFRVFNPTTQIKKFDANLAYIRKWVPEFEELTYPAPVVDHKFARERAIETYKLGLQN